ncbi:MAG: ribosome biogenesis GTPase Der [Tissierellia bacterium]|nr:ribosome biogenesis GTPase Der [Tissierellia bacterium]
MKLPIIAIVGRPNVGKSTLFNKLVGKRLAITEDKPGVTRDRLYADGEWQGRHFTVVDTGGLEPRSDDVFLSHIEQQVEIAVDMADLVLFIVDGRSGMTAVDQEIAHMLRRTKKEVIVAVNKVDFKKMEDAVYEFYETGFTEIYPISAENSLNLGDLLDAMVEKLPQMEENPDEDLTKVCVMGKPNVGKSSLINYLLGEKRMIVTDIAGTTRDAIDSKVSFKDHEYIFIDTAGLRKKRSVEQGVERYSVIRTLNAVDRSDICILMIDATEGVTEQDTKIAGYAHEQNKAIMIVVNKWDLIDKDTKTMGQFEKNIRTKLAFIPYAPLLFISVKDKIRVEHIFNHIDIIDNNYSLRVKTGVLNEILNDAVLRNPPPSDKGVRLKIFYIAQVSTRPPVFLLYINKRELMHFSYLRYLENKIRENFGFEGVPLVFHLKIRRSSK